MKIKEDCGHGSEDGRAHCEWSENEGVPPKRLRGLGSSDGSGRCDVSNCGIGNNGLIATNKEQCQDKETPKGGPVNKKKRSRPVVTGKQAAQRKNSRRQWGRPFGRAPREICPAISTHPHRGGDCTTTLRWQDVDAGHTEKRTPMKYQRLRTDRLNR